MPVIRFLWGVFLLYSTFGVLFGLLVVLAGCSASGEMPECVSGCTMTKSWGVM